MVVGEPGESRWNFPGFFVGSTLVGGSFSIDICLTSISRLLVSKGKYEEAEPLYKRSLSIDEKVYGPDQEVARDLNNWAGLLAGQVRAV